MFPSRLTIFEPITVGVQTAEAVISSKRTDLNNTITLTHTAADLLTLSSNLTVMQTLTADKVVASGSSPTFTLTKAGTTPFSSSLTNNGSRLVFEHTPLFGSYEPYHTGNKPSPSDIGAASSGHTHDYSATYAAKTHAHTAADLAQWLSYTPVNKAGDVGVGQLTGTASLSWGSGGNFRTQGAGDQLICGSVNTGTYASEGTWDIASVVSSSNRGLWLRNGTDKQTWHFLATGATIFPGPLTAIQFNGSGAGLTGTANSLTAGRANQLTTARTINGIAFDGSANVTVHDGGPGIGISGTTVSIAANYSPNTASELVNGTDLNTIVTPGFYYESANADAQQGSNFPAAYAGALQVYRHAGVAQIYTTYNPTNPQQYFRSKYVDSWSPWRMVIHSGNIGSQSVANAGAAARLNWQGDYANADVGTGLGPAGLSLWGCYNNGYPMTYGEVLHVHGRGAGQLLLGWSETDGAHAPLYYRSKRDNTTGAWSAWAQLITSANITSQSVNYAASAGNADTLDGSHASAFATTGHSHTLIDGVYTGSGGLQPPSYIPSGKVRFNMMNGPHGGGYYCDYLLMDTYSGPDVPYVTGLGLLKAAGTPRGYLAVGAKGASSWTSSVELITTGNIANQSVSYAAKAGGIGGLTAVAKGNGTAMQFGDTSSGTYQLYSTGGQLYLARIS